MFVKKIISTTITIEDFQTLRSKNIDNVIFGMVKDKFENICYSKCYIIEVLRLISIGDIESNQNDVINCSFNVNVLFEIYCEFYQSLEPILDMKILNIRNNSITLGSDNKIAVLKPNTDENVENIIKGFEKGDYFPVRAGRCIYEPASNKIKIGCVPFKTSMVKDLDVKYPNYKITKNFIESGNFDKVLSEISIDSVENNSNTDKNNLLRAFKDSFRKDIKNEDHIIISIDKTKDAEWLYKIINDNSYIEMNSQSLFLIVSEMYIIKKQVKDFKNRELYSEAKLKLIYNE